MINSQNKKKIQKANNLDMITDAYIGFVIDRKLYYLQGGVDESSSTNKLVYTNNVNIANSIFIEITDNREVIINGAFKECIINSDKSLYCFNE